MKMTKTRYVSHAAIIAAIYVVLTYLTNLIGLANGAVQCRLSEALCVLPAFTPAAIPGLFIGCFLSNLLTGCALPDIIFGSVATLLGAYGTMFLSQRGCSKYLLSLPAIVSNTLIIPLVLKYAYGLNGGLIYFILTVGLGEVISCGVLGAVLYASIEKKSNQLFG